MLGRVLVAIVGIPLLLLLLLFFPPICVPIALSVMDALAVYEMLWTTRAIRHKGLVALSMILAFCVPFWYYFGTEIGVGLTALFVYMLSMFVMAIQSNQAVKFSEMAMSFFAATLFPMMISAFVLLADLSNGKIFLILPFVSSFCSDAAALFFGLLFGKHKLAPVLSPKKTVEGSVGGFVGSVLGCLIYSQVLRLGFEMTPILSVFLLYAVIGSLISQMGDLSFSYIKREFKIKDYGCLFGAHGGVLDRLDSVMFCVPFTYIMVTALPFFAG